MDKLTGEHQLDVEEAATQDDEQTIKFTDWGFKVDRLFEVAHRFYKRNESKAFHPTFDIRNQMNALILQAKYGDYDNGRVPDIGVLDFVGRRRQYEWTLLKGMSKTEAMSKFICNLDSLCPFFKAHTEAVKVSLESNSNDKRYTSDGHRSGPSSVSSVQSSEDQDQLKAIYASLCRQTYDQFKSYAEKQHPDDIPQQKQMIKSLQDQYFQQYITQMHPDLKHSTEVTTSSTDNHDVKSEKFDMERSQETAPNCTIITADSTAAKDTLAPETLNEQSLSPKLKKDIALDKDIDSPNFLPSKSLDHSIPTNEPSSILIETDISSEELNTVSSASHQIGESEANNGTDSTSSPKIMHESSLANNGPVQKIQQASSVVEHVRLYQNNELPSIGLFESFPEPKPIQSVPQTPRATIEDLNPNIRVRVTGNVLASKGALHDLPGETPAELDNNKNLHLSERLTQNSSSSPINNKLQARGVFNLENHHLPSLPPLQLINSDNPNPSVLVELGEVDCPQPSELDHTTSVQGNASIFQCAQTSPPPADVDIGYKPPEPWGQIESDSCDEDEVGDDDRYGVDHLLDAAQQGQFCEPASTWSKKGVSEFKESLADDKQGGIYEVKEGTAVVIQVPTYPHGRYIYWEFATDDYDIAFGLEFVHETNLIQPLALNIYEDEDDDEYDDLVEPIDHTTANGAKVASSHRLDEEAAAIGLDAYQTSSSNSRNNLISSKNYRLANTVMVVPTYRRDSHEEVFVGRHKYPGTGYYLLRFDNTYSVMRSKTLYFRICCFV